MNKILAMVVDATRALAMPSIAQTALFPQFVVVADELALNFDEAYSALPRLVQAGLISPEQAQSLATLDALLQTMTDCGDSELWTNESLAGRPEWHQVRSAAQAALRALEASGQATLEGIEYVRG